MQFAEMKAIYAQVHQADQTCRREYALSERAAVSLTFMASDRNPIPLVLLQHRIFASLDGHWDPDALEQLSPQELVKLAEIKAMTDAWVAGKQDDLPPSNSQRIADAEAAFHRKHHSM